MSLFKRKQSKEKDIGDHGQNMSPGSNQVNGSRNGPAMPNGIAQNQNVRRMTSNPTINGMPNGHMPNGTSGPGGPGGPPYGSPNGPSTSYSTPNLNGMHMQNGGPPGPPGPPGQPGQGMQSPQSQPPTQIQPTQRPQSTAPGASYPWFTRPLRLYAPQTSPPSPPQSPFPRYGLSVPAFPSHSGHMLLFGGLVHETVKNDLWSMDVRDCSTMLVKTRGDAPMPRVGHASAMADRIMLVWGGDTKVKPEDVQDEGLYILDLRTQEWTSVPVAPGPVGRYGHAVCMQESRFFIFGGQAEGSFMNDLWSYDIKQLGVAGVQHRWEQIKFTTPAPPARTGHALVAHQGKLLLFGGTDGMYHYNDTWSFDIATGAWTELSCIGYIPVPREGHAVAIVDDVFYIFGGRDVNGKDLGDLAAFRIANQRWYMFQNMGPAPTPRSGHAMVAAHGKIFVIGGEANATSAQTRDDPSILHVLDTTKIKYPPDNAPPKQIKARPSDAGSQQNLDQSAQSSTPGSNPQSLPPSSSVNGLTQGPSPPVQNVPLPDQQQQSPHVQQSMMSPQQQMQPQPLAPVINSPNGTAIPRSESNEQISQPVAPQRAPPMAPMVAPQRPRREGDEEYRRAMSPINQSGPSSPAQPGFPSSSPQQQSRNGFSPGILGTRSPSPRLRNPDGDRPAPPPDAFYYGRSPVNGSSGRPSSVSNQGELMRELRARDMDIEAGKKREATLRVIIGKAVQQGFVSDDPEAVNLDNEQTNNDDQIVKKLGDALLRLKQEKAAIQSEMVSQMKQASAKAVEAERLRRGALQEAAFFRAKLATLESGNPMDLARIEKERINELERQLANLHSDHSFAQRELQRATGDVTASRDLHSAAVQREAETLKRAEDAEEAHRTAIEEMEELQQRAQTAERSLHDHSERLVTLSSSHQQREAERDRLQSQLDDAIRQRDDHLGVIERAQQAIHAAGTRTAEMEQLHGRSTERLGELEDELADTKAELESRTREAHSASIRLNEVEEAYAKSREEAESLRLMTTSGLGDLVESNRDLRSDESRFTKGHQEQLRALEEEGSALRKMLKEAGQRLDTAESGVSHHRQKARDLEAQHQALRGEMRTHRTNLLNAQNELSRYKNLQAVKDAELKERDVAVTEIETRCTMLRNLLADHGIAVSDADLSNAESSNTRELETQLRERTRAHDNAQREIEELTRRCHESEDKVESLGRLVERMKDARSPTSMSMRSPSPPGGSGSGSGSGGDSDRRVAEAERKMAELETQHKEKMAALEGDYQTAVRYVKGTEKMLKRMKDELNKQKDANKSLQSEINEVTGRSSEPGARTRDASGRATPSLSDPELSRKIDKLQSQHNALQAELSASRDVLSAREREVEVLRMRCEEAEREVDGLREDLSQAQQRISTLLEMGGVGPAAAGYQLHSEDEDGLGDRRASGGSSEEASMAFDKFTKELKQWERARSPQNGSLESEDDTARLAPAISTGKHGMGHRRNSSEYSGDWIH